MCRHSVHRDVPLLYTAMISFTCKRVVYTTHFYFPFSRSVACWLLGKFPHKSLRRGCAIFPSNTEPLNFNFISIAGQLADRPEAEKTPELRDTLTRGIESGQEPEHVKVVALIPHRASSPRVSLIKTHHGVPFRAALSSLAAELSRPVLPVRSQLPQPEAPSGISAEREVFGR